TAPATASALVTATATQKATTSRPPPTVHVTTTTGQSGGGEGDCKIPYTIGPNGEKIWKRHCFQ
ncbi:MAG TPA: hypothetical protein VGH87_27130, partial [Polyangiaceae bacterium]